MFIIQFWDTNSIPPYISTLIESFKEQNVWANHTLFDKGSARRFIAANFSNREARAFRSCAVAAMQADYFRYCGVFSLGGIYADADTLCVGNIGNFFNEKFNDGALFRMPNGNIMNAFFLFRSTESPFLKIALEICTANIEQSYCRGRMAYYRARHLQLYVITL